MGTSIHTLDRHALILISSMAMWRLSSAVMLFLSVAMGLMAVKGERKCGLQDLVLSNDYKTTSLCEWGLVNNCPCDASNIVANCEDRRWNQNLVSRFAMAVDVPTVGRCTLFPNSVVFPASRGLRYGRSYPCADPIPLSLVSADFGDACK